MDENLKKIQALIHEYYKDLSKELESLGVSDSPLNISLVLYDDNAESDDDVNVFVASNIDSLDSYGSFVNICSVVFAADDPDVTSYSLDIDDKGISDEKHDDSKNNFEDLWKLE